MKGGEEMKGEEMNTELEQAQDMLNDHLERKAEMDVQRQMQELLAKKINAVIAMKSENNDARTVRWMQATYDLDLFLYDVWEKRINAYDTRTVQLESAVALLKAAEETPKRPTMAEIKLEVEEEEAEPDAAAATTVRKQRISKKRKTEVWNRWVGETVGLTKCLCCGLVDITSREFVAGHVHPEKEGGTIDVDNLRPICAACNGSMGARHMKAYMQEYYPSRSLL